MPISSIAKALQQKKMKSKQRQFKLKQPTKQPTKRTVKKITKDQKQDRQIQSLRKSIANTMAHYTYHYRDTGELNSVSCGVNFTYLYGNYNTNLETAISNLKYFNPSVPGTLITVDGRTGTFTKEFDFNYVSQRITFRNNYQVPLKLTHYICVPKSDSSQNPITTFTDGLTDVGGPSNTSTMIKLSDSPVFNKLWKIVKTTTRFIDTGKQMVTYYKTKPFKYDPAYNDAHSSSYKPRDKSFMNVIRLEGVMGHDSVQAEYGPVISGVDYEHCITWDFNYDAGSDIRYIHIADSGATAFTNAGQICNKPANEHQTFSAV